MDRNRTEERSPQGLKPQPNQVVMSEPKLLPPKENSGKRTGLKTGHCKASWPGRTVLECDAYKGEERRNGGVNPPLQLTQERIRALTHQGYGRRSRPQMETQEKELTPEGVSYRRGMRDGEVRAASRNRKRLA
jgi:hypothetical protein